jgi:GNAT superfamily N-acetyltransferase
MPGKLEPLFRSHTRLRAVLDAVLEGRGGRVLTAADSPQAAILDFGCYRIPGGDAGSDEAERLISSLAGPCEIVIPDDDGWRVLVDRVFGARVRDRSMQAFVPGADLEARVRAFSRAVPEGYELRRLDATTAALVGPELSPHGIDVAGGPEKFVEHGLGWGLLADGALACVSTSYAVSKSFVEVSIATHASHRRRGLAACAASALIHEALERSWEPHWNAFNPISKRLAHRLGFAEAGRCEILALDLVEPTEGAVAP